MERVPVASQADLPFCYAYSAAQMADAWRFSHQGPDGHHVSPIVAALEAATRHRWPLAHLNRRELAETGGTVCPVLDFLRGHAACDERVLHDYAEARDVSRMSRALRQAYEVYHDYTDRFRHYRLSMDNIGGQGAPDGRLRAELRAVARDRITQVLNEAGYAEMTPARDELEGLLEKSNPLDFLKALVSRGCRDGARFQARIPDCHRMGRDDDPARMIERIHRRLGGADPQPTAISYCSELLSRGREYFGRERAQAGAPCVHDDGHVSLVVGRRRDPASGRCQLLVRNTWGADCDGYHRDWHCPAENPGNVYVDEGALRANLYGISYLE
jgi:hypothetical protein